MEYTVQEQTALQQLRAVHADYPHFLPIFRERMASGAIIGDVYTDKDKHNLIVGCFFGWLSGYVTGAWAGRLGTLTSIVELADRYMVHDDAISTLLYDVRPGETPETSPALETLDRLIVQIVAEA